MSATDEAFTNFLRGLDPRTVEVERFGWPAATERPGSAADKRMRREHEKRKVELAAAREDRAATYRRACLIEAAHDLRFKGTPEQEHEIAAYAARKREQRKAS